ncbi:MAG: DUF768 domain-containing protein [Mesorhizobium sp.]|nr:MAG: DUF768 domain-containing protein [Mesorhizobium sp.]
MAWSDETDITEEQARELITAAGISEDEIEEEIGSAYEAILAAINGPPDFESE